MRASGLPPAGGGDPDDPSKILYHSVGSKVSTSIGLTSHGPHPWLLRCVFFIVVGSTPSQFPTTLRLTRLSSSRISGAASILYLVPSGAVMTGAPMSIQRLSAPPGAPSRFLTSPPRSRGRGKFGWTIGIGRSVRYVMRAA